MRSDARKAKAERLAEQQPPADIREAVAGLAEHLADMLEWHALVDEAECFCGWEPAVEDADTYADLADAIEAEHRAHVAEHMAASLRAILDRFPATPSDAADREALTEALYRDPDLGPGYMFRDDCEHLASRFLASDWLAAHDRRVRAEAWDEGWKAVLPEGHEGNPHRGADQ